MARDYSLSVAAAMWRYAEDRADKERRNTIMRTKTDDINLPPPPDMSSGALKAAFEDETAQEQGGSDE